MFDLTGKVVFVAGGAGYLGIPICKALAEQGATVVIADLAIERANEAAAGIKSQLSGAVVHAVALDVADESSIQQAVKKAVELCGRLDVLVNAILSLTGKRIEDIAAAEFTASMQIQLTGSFLLAREAGDVMPSGGSMIFFASMYGQVSPDPRSYPGTMIPNSIDYGVGKAGMIQMMKYLAVFWASRGIRVNCIAPGPFPNLKVQAEHPEFIKRLSDRIPLGRIGQNHEIAGPVVFLASDEASFVTGEILCVNGGYTSW